VLHLKRTVDQDEIKKILFHPEIELYIPDGVDLRNDLPTENVIYIGGYADGLFAVSCFHCFGDGLKFHPYILPDHRRQYARDFVKQCLDMVDCPIYIEIPTTRKRLFNFAKKIGFDSIVNNKDPSKHLMRLL